MKRLLALLLSLVLLVSAIPASADDLNWLHFEATLCDVIFADLSPAAIFEEDLQALVACFLLIEYASAYDDSAADYVSIDGCYIGYMDDAYWCSFPNVTNDSILSIVYSPGTPVQAAHVEGYGGEDSLATQAAQMAETVTECREVTIAEMNIAFEAILELLSDD